MSNKVAQITNDFREVLARLREDPGGGGRHSRHQRDDKKFNAMNFDGSLNPNSYLKWVQSIERFFHVKDYSMKRPSKQLSISLKAMLSFGMRVLQSKELRMISVKLEHGLSLRNPWINGS